MLGEAEYLLQRASLYLTMSVAWLLRTADSVPVPVLLALILACLMLLRWPCSSDTTPLPTHFAFAPYSINEKRPQSPLCSYFSPDEPVTPVMPSSGPPSPIPQSPYSAKLVETSGGFTWVPIRRSSRSFSSISLREVGGVGPRGLGILNELDEEIGLCGV